jgi:hypothetical protein
LLVRISDDLADEILSNLDREIFDSFVVNLGYPDLALEAIITQVVTTSNNEFGQAIVAN